MPNKQVLKNDIRLITAPLQETQTASILVLTRVGSRYESRETGGISHFIEHMLFKGTDKRPDTLALAKALDGVGAEFNAFTSKDITAYYVKADFRHLSLAIDVLSDMLLHSKFDEGEIEKEKGVIVEEINMYEDNPIMYVEDLLEQTMFGDNELGRTISGSRENVRSLNRDKMLEYRDQFYNGKNTVIAVAGRFADSHLKEIEEKFVLPAGEGKNQFTKLSFEQKEPRLTVKDKETEQVQVALGFPAYAYGDPRVYILQLLSVILGGNMSSRLFLEVREKNGLAYFIRSSVGMYEDIGTFVIQAGLDKNRIDDAIKLIMLELKKIKDGIVEEELQRAKDYLAGKLAIDLEDSAELSQWYGQQELMCEKMLTPGEKIKIIMAINRDEIINIARDVLDFNRVSLAVIGPFKEAEERFKKLLV
ncbi:MAG: pitrilysin family protein [Patescibacteria group bacterium]